MFGNLTTFEELAFFDVLDTFDVFDVLEDFEDFFVEGIAITLLNNVVRIYGSIPWKYSKIV